MNRKARNTMLILAGVCLLPVAASYGLYYFAPPSQTVNYGELIPPAPLEAGPLAALDGAPLPLAHFRGRWVMLTVDTAECAERCRRKLYYMRQVRIAQNEEMRRVERLWVLRGGGTPSAELLREHDGLHVAAVAGSGLLERLPAARDAAEHVYLIDPLGNLILRYPPDPDPKRMIKDVARLLKYSRIG